MTGRIVGGPPLRAVVFDYGGVLTNPLSQTMAFFCRRMGISPDQLVGALQRVAEEWGDFPMNRLEVAGCSEAEMTDAVLRHLPPSVPSRMAGETFGQHWFAGRATDPLALSLVANARTAGLLTGLLTNNVREWRRLWQRQLDVSTFDVVVDSSVEGLRKPDPEIYVRMLRRLGVDPESCLFVDDVEVNCEAARRIGMHAALWLGPETADAVRAAVAAADAVRPVAGAR